MHNDSKYPYPIFIRCNQITIDPVLTTNNRLSNTYWHNPLSSKLIIGPWFNHTHVYIHIMNTNLDSTTTINQTKHVTLSLSLLKIEHAHTSFKIITQQSIETKGAWREMETIRAQQSQVVLNRNITNLCSIDQIQVVLNKLGTHMCVLNFDETMIVIGFNIVMGLREKSWP